MIAACSTNLGVCASDARQPDEAQSPTAQPRQEALRHLGAAVMGSRKTGSESGLEPGKREPCGLFPVKTSARKQRRLSPHGRHFH